MLIISEVENDVLAVWLEDGWALALQVLMVTLPTLQGMHTNAHKSRSSFIGLFVCRPAIHMVYVNFRSVCFGEKWENAARQLLTPSPWKLIKAIKAGTG